MNVRFPGSNRFAKLDVFHLIVDDGFQAAQLDEENVSQFLEGLWQGSLYYQSKQGTIIGEIHQNYPMFALFDPPKIGNLMPPVWLTLVFQSYLLRFGVLGMFLASKYLLTRCLEA